MTQQKYKQLSIAIVINRNEYSKQTECVLGHHLWHGVTSWLTCSIFCPPKQSYHCTVLAPIVYDVYLNLY